VPLEKTDRRERRIFNDCSMLRMSKQLQTSVECWTGVGYVGPTLRAVGEDLKESLLPKSDVE
jgi:hypothetical protein